MKTRFPATVIVFGVVSSAGHIMHLTSSKSAWKSTPKCIWMCWRVWWSPGAIRWLVTDPGGGSRTRRQPTSPKKTQAWLQKEFYDFVPFSHWPPPPPTWSCWTTLFGHTSRTSPTWPPTTPKPTWSTALEEKSCSQFRIRIEAVIEAEGNYI